MEIKVKTEITTEPVTLAVQRVFMTPEVTTDGEDAMITAMIKSARQLIEKYCNIAMAAKVLQLYMHKDELDEDRRIILPYGPHKTVDSFYSIDLEGTETALTVDEDYYKQGNQFFELSLANQMATWGGLQVIADYRVEFACGYGITSYTETLPSIFADAIKQQVMLWYRRDYEDYQGQLSKNVMSMIQPFSRNPWI